MKKIVLTLLCTIAISVGTFAQEFAAPSKSKQAFTDTTTTYTYKLPEKTYPVYISKNGAYYIWKVSKKTGKIYKYYLPKEIQIKMGRKYDD